MRVQGLASSEATAAYARRYEGKLSPPHFRAWNGLTLSSIGFGTYLGPHDNETDALYKAAVRSAVDLGCNVIDTAINYRYQRSERAIGEALVEMFAAGLARSALLISTKGGFFPFEGHPPADARKYIEETFVSTGIISGQDVVADCHCMAPSYLKTQLETSLRNLRLEAVDIYYLHNPEMQLPEIGRAEFLRRIRAAFAFLEEAAREGKIGVYGAATWSGFRQPEKSPDHLSLAELVEIAREVGGGEDHHFRAIQLPVNLAMGEALVRPNQTTNGGKASLLEAASRLGMIVMSSGSIYQGQLARGLPPSVADALPGLETDAQRALQFARSAPGITTALVGMKTIAHVAENLALARRPPAEPEQIHKLFH